MNFLELAQSRKSIRSFKSDVVSNDLVIKLLEAARSAPSGGNCQPWHFFVIKEDTVKLQICQRACTQAWLPTAPVLLVVCADKRLNEERYGDRGRNLYCLQDTAAAIQNILLCATSLGLGTCWCGAFDEAAVSDILNLDKNVRPVAIIPVGYYMNETPKTKRRPIEEIATFI